MIHVETNPQIIWWEFVRVNVWKVRCTFFPIFLHLPFSLRSATTWPNEFCTIENIPMSADTPRVYYTLIESVKVVNFKPEAAPNSLIAQNKERSEVEKTYERMAQNERDALSSLPQLDEESW